MNPSLGNRHSQHSFAQVPTANTPRSKFNRSFAAKDTANFDELTPFFLDEVLPGDTINLNVKTFIRLATQAVPMMENMHIDFYFFYEPNRILWNNFEKQMGAQENPGDSIDYLTPTLLINSMTNAFGVGTLGDHFGLTTGVGNEETWAVSALPFRMYNDVFNQWFRDQNLQPSLPVPRGDGPDALSTFLIKKSAKKHDYFTSSLPFPQKGNAVDLLAGHDMPVVPNTIGLLPQQYPSFAPNNNQSDTREMYMLNAAGNYYQYNGPVLGGASQAYWAQETGLMVDGSSLIVTINSFREAIMLQSFLEQDARGGTRFTEILKSHFNVISPDARLQRPEFLSAATIQISQHPVAQTSESSGTPQGNLAAFSTAAEFGNKIGFSKSFVEHGWVMGLFRARADVTYQQGHNRMWTRRTRYDYFWPKFQELGEQPVYLQEIYVTNSPANQNIFGYQERHAEYRYRPSEIRGQFRSTYAESLDVWHLAEEFGTFPTLGSTFIQGNTPIERALVVSEGYPALLCDFWFDYNHVRPMIAYPVPASLGRF